jgi:folate-binding protein YgfZ
MIDFLNCIPYMWYNQIKDYSMSISYTSLDHRALVKIAGVDKKEFIQGLISNDVSKITSDSSIYAAFLTPQGKFLEDLFISEIDDSYYIDTALATRDEFIKKLKMYKLRSDVTISTVDDYDVFAFFGDNLAKHFDLSTVGQTQTIENATIYLDPRHAELGVRALLPKDNQAQILKDCGFTKSNLQGYDRKRIPLGIPDGARDIPREKGIILEYGLDELHAVDWDKGCYLGQELTSRTKYRGIVRKRLMPIDINGASPDFGTTIYDEDRKAGEIRTCIGHTGLALIRLKSIGSKILRTENTRITPKPQNWMVFDMDNI